MPSPPRPRIAVISPFIDKRHGTERCIAEQIERLAKFYEIHLYTSSVEDLNLSEIILHRVPAISGPHLFRYLWFVIANHFIRWRDRTFRRLSYEVIYSPGVNCLDANLVSVHVLFVNLRRQFADSLALRRNSITSWHVVIHRRIYYRLAVSMERKLYPRESVSIVAVSQKVARQIREQFGQKDHLSVIYHGVDHAMFSPELRKELRQSAREKLGIAPDAFAVLLIGNDWKNKGLPCLLEAAAKLNNPRLHLLAVGDDSPANYKEICSRLGLNDQISFLPLRADVNFYYAAADLYAGPSIEDTFSLPVVEAMACGLPAITSRAAGASEIIHHGDDGMILEDPADAKSLSGWIKRFVDDSAWRNQMGEAATKTAAAYTWERNAQQLGEVIDSIIRQRNSC
jgi:UDP-glucose:(heptosyl)LPS alpha-1,3-glucosyltransferase